MATKTTFNIRYDGSSIENTSSGDFKGKHIFLHVSMKTNCSKRVNEISLNGGISKDKMVHLAF